MADRHLSTARAYRDSVCPQQGEIRFQVAVEQTDLLIVAEKDMQAEIASHVAQVRGEIKNWILFHPEFSRSLSPVDIPDSAPAIIRAMGEAARACDVGPMAAVAGAVAQSVGDAFAVRSPNILVENGGDTYLHSTRERVVALLAEPDSGAMVGMKVEAEAFPMAICASSATIGHSLSLGSGDLVAVRAGMRGLLTLLPPRCAISLRRKQISILCSIGPRRLPDTGLKESLRNIIRKLPYGAIWNWWRWTEERLGRAFSFLCCA